MRNLIPGFIKNINLGRFIVSVLLALIVWGYVIATQYPERTLPPFEVPLGEAIPPPAGLEVDPRPEQISSVSVIISGQSDRVSNIVPSQIRPYLDLSNIKQPGRHEVEVKLRPSSLPTDITTRIEPKTVPIWLERKISVVKPVEVVPDGEVNPDYILEGPIQVSPNIVNISGRESVVERVSKAQVVVPLSGRVGNLRANLPLRLVDAKDQAINANELTIEPRTVNVSANINYKFQTRTVPIRVTTKGDPAPGYIAGSAKTTQPLITITSGDAKLLNEVEFIPTQPLDISGASNDRTGTVSLDPPPFIAPLGSTTVQVTVSIVAFQTSKTLAVALEYVNRAENLQYFFSTINTINLTISGPFQAFQDLPVDRIKATVDLQNQGVGNHTLPVQVELPSKELVVTSNPTVNVTVTLPPTPTPLPTRRPPTPTPVPPTPAPTTTPAASPSGAVTPAATTTAPPATTTQPLRPAITPSPAATNPPAPTAAPPTTTPPVGVAPPPDARNSTPSPTQPPVSPTAAPPASPKASDPRLDGTTPSPAPRGLAGVITAIS